MALQLGNKTHAAVALTFLASIYKDFGDVKKSIMLLEQSALLKGFLIRDEESKEDSIEVPIKSRNVFEVIRKHGVTDGSYINYKTEDPRIYSKSCI